MSPAERQRGFEELPHTADWAMRVWAEDLPGLFAEAAHGMNTLAGVQLAPGPRLDRTYEHEATDSETLLVAFLSELIYLQEQERLGFDIFRIELQAAHLAAHMSGSSLVSIQKPIKAVTFYNLKIVPAPRGFVVEIVFDV
jgi:protein archease